MTPLEMCVCQLPYGVGDPAHIGASDNDQLIVSTMLLAAGGVGWTHHYENMGCSIQEPIVVAMWARPV